jgi:autotransporter-associated beta strand protein
MSQNLVEGYELAWCVLLFFTTGIMAQIPAFPGAEGYGALATGGRGGTVYHVTTLADSGSGSFRDAVSQPNRTVVFDVGGTIVLGSSLGSRLYMADNLTIAGQTAPGQGICIYSNSVYFATTWTTNISGTNYAVYEGSTNVICRFVRFRQGVDAGPTSWSLALINSKNVIVDHCSIELGCWQTLAVQWSEPPVGSDMAENITLQNCIVGAGLNNQMGCLAWGVTNLTFHHTLWIDNGSRDPKISDNNAQLINDVLYNPQLGIYGPGGENIDLIGCYHISGPSKPNSTGIYIGDSAGRAGNFYFTNNVIDQNVNGKLDGLPLMTNSTFNPDSISPTPYCSPTIPVTIDTPQVAYYKVGSQSGPWLARDAVDNLLISQLVSLGTQGQVYTNETQLGSMTLPVAFGPADTDQDGMPDEWELAIGSDYATANNNVVEANGYTKLENYLNWLAAPHLKTYKNTTASDFDLWPLTMAFTNRSPVYSLANPTNGSVTLVSNRWARFVPTANFTGLGSFTFTVVATNGPTMTNLVGVLITPILPATNLVWRGDAVANAWNLYLTNDWFNGTTLQPFNGDDNVTFDDSGSNSLPVNIIGELSPNSLLVNSTKNYTLGGNGALVGNFTLTKSNSGTLTLVGTNSFSGGLFINGGMVVVTNSPSAGGSGTVYLNGGTLNEANASFTNPISCSGTNTWIISGGVNASPSSTLTGSGRLLLSPIASGQFTPVGDWSGFSGTIFFTGVNPQMRIYGGNSGSAGATFDLGTNTGKLYNRNGNLTVQLGALAGGAGTTLSGASAVAAPTTYVIGSNNLNSTFAGKIVDDPANGISSVVKVGTGTLTLTGTNTFSGTTTISNGVLLVNNSAASGTGTNLVNVYSGATLGGTGVISGPVTILTSGTLSPGSPQGTLTISNSLTLSAGSISSFSIGTNSDRVAVKGNLTLGGTLNVTNLGGLAAGTNTLFTYTGALAGNLALGALPPGFRFVLNTNSAGQVNLIVAKPVITAVRMVSTNFVFAGTGGVATSIYFLLTSTNLTLPLANWTRLATNQFNSSGNFGLTNAMTAGKQNQFYLIQVP